MPSSAGETYPRAPDQEEESETSQRHAQGEEAESIQTHHEVGRGSDVSSQNHPWAEKQSGAAILHAHRWESGGGNPRSTAFESGEQTGDGSGGRERTKHQQWHLEAPGQPCKEHCPSE